MDSRIPKLQTVWATENIPWCGTGWSVVRNYVNITCSRFLLHINHVACFLMVIMLQVFLRCTCRLGLRFHLKNPFIVVLISDRTPLVHFMFFVESGFFHK